MKQAAAFAGGAGVTVPYEGRRFSSASRDVIGMNSRDLKFWKVERGVLIIPGESQVVTVSSGWFLSVRHSRS